MKLDINTNQSGKDKYAAINLRKIPGNPQTVEELAAAILRHPDSVEFNVVGSTNEFFHVKLKDENADAALFGYAGKAISRDPEYAAEVAEMAKRAGSNSPFCKAPD
jgi:hypothetical protein